MADTERKTIHIKWIRSGIGFPRSMKKVVQGLGLSKLNQIVERPNTPQIRGMVAKIPHLVTVVEEPVPPAWASVPEYVIKPPEVAPTPETEAVPEAPTPAPEEMPAAAEAAPVATQEEAEPMVEAPAPKKEEEKAAPPAPKAKAKAKEHAAPAKAAKPAKKDKKQEKEVKETKGKKDKKR